MATVYISKLNLYGTTTIDGVAIEKINIDDPNNGFRAISIYSEREVRVEHNGTNLQYVDGAFADGVFFTASYEAGYLTFRNGDRFVTYK